MASNKSVSYPKSEFELEQWVSKLTFRNSLFYLTILYKYL